MSNNTVIDIVIGFHAPAATISLVLGAANLLRRPKGDRIHRRIGRIWVVAMYVTVLTSFAIKRLHPGHFTWFHALSVWTFISLTIGLWAAMTHRIRLHRGFMTGSYFGLVGAFIGAVVVPQRVIPQLAVHHPVVLVLAVLGAVALGFALVATARRSADPAPKATDPQPTR